MFHFDSALEFSGLHLENEWPLRKPYLSFCSVSLHLSQVNITSHTWFENYLVSDNFCTYHGHRSLVFNKTHSRNDHIIFSIILHKSCDVVNVILCFDKLKNQAIDIINGHVIGLHKSFFYYLQFIEILRIERVFERFASNGSFNSAINT